MRTSHTEEKYQRILARERLARYGFSVEVRDRELRQPFADLDRCFVAVRIREIKVFLRQVFGAQLLDQLTDRGVARCWMTRNPTVRIHVDSGRRPTRADLLCELAFLLKQDTSILGKFVDIRRNAARANEDDHDLVHQL